MLESQPINFIADLEKAALYLKQLDLRYIIDTMCCSSYFLPRWTMEEATHCCSLYKNFLYLQKKYPQQNLVPSREIDEFWHNHILATRNYWRDCMSLFGYYLHHDPVPPDAPSEELISNYMKTKELYFSEFNQPLDLIQK